MRMNSEIRKKYYNICYKQRLNGLFSNNEMEEQFYAQKRLIKSMFRKNEEELASICEKAAEKAESDFNFFTTLS